MHVFSWIIWFYKDVRSAISYSVTFIKVDCLELVEDLEGMWSMQQGSGSFCFTSRALREINS